MLYYQNQKPPRYGDGIYKTIRWHLGHYLEIEKAVKIARIEGRSNANKPEIHAEGFISNPTASEAIQNLTPLPSVEIRRGIVKNPEAWLAVIDTVLRQIDESDRRLIVDTFFRGLPWNVVIEENHIDKDAYYRRRERVISLIGIAAASAGLITLE